MEDPIRQALDGDDSALREIYAEFHPAPTWRERLFGDGLTSAMIILLLVPAVALAAWGQAQAVGMFGMSPPQALPGALWAWVGCKLPLVALAWLVTIERRRR